MRLLPNVIKTEGHFYTVTGNKSDKLYNEILEKALQDADRIIASAEEYKKCADEEIKEASARAKEKCESIYLESKSKGLAQGISEGREIGFNQGYQDAVAKFNEEVADLLLQLQDAVETVDNARSNVIEKQKSSLPDIVAAVCLEIIGKKIDECPETMQLMIENALDSYRNENWLNIYLSKKVYEKVCERESDFLQRIRSVSSGARIFPCREFDDADCIVELPSEILDISTTSQLEKIKHALRK